MTRAGAGTLPSLEALLATALDRSGVRAWIDEDGRRALREPASDPLRVAVALGRILRMGDLSVATLRQARSWLLASLRPEGGSPWSDVVAPGAMRAVDGAERDLLANASDVATLVLARDDAESVLTVLGTLSMVSDDEATAAAEILLARSLAKLDEAAEARLEALVTRVHREPFHRSAWLARAIAADAAPWWLDLAGLAYAARGLATHAPAPLPLASRVVVARSAMRRAASVAEVVACGEDEAPASPEGALVARMFDGEITVFARGLRDGDTGEAGLFVCQADGAVNRIEAVRLDPPGDHAAARGQTTWSVPLGGRGRSPEPRALVVRYRAENATHSSEERLAIEFR